MECLEWLSGENHVERRHFMVDVVMGAAVYSRLRQKMGDNGTVFTSYVALQRRAGRGAAW
jgi:hypothetical protein